MGTDMHRHEITDSDIYIRGAYISRCQLSSDVVNVTFRGTFPHMINFVIGNPDKSWNSNRATDFESVASYVRLRGIFVTLKSQHAKESCVNWQSI